jgi:hypothetical protein
VFTISYEGTLIIKIISTVRLHAGNQTWHFSLTWLIFCRLALIVQTYSCSFAYGTSWKQTVLSESKLKTTTTLSRQRAVLQIQDSIFLSYSDLFLPTPVGVECYWCIWWRSMTHTHTHPPSVHSSARRFELSKWHVSYNTHNRHTFRPTGFELSIPAKEEPQARALDGAGTGIVH